ncbi:hypothetical protein [Photobacterium chitinilyticum]|uniref:Uncharacterized protein n=1 Tax=Photobacterium chitinilyticum TaxID=2485123 RepID=A0A444JLY5_9GAMM|nr:hypothetical protein [Photobacterium chitinilyticum]RWX54090.1 hypothetical protein EDI28_17810 [Photobacterium chitinilyticum]
MKNWLDYTQDIGPIMRFSVVVNGFAFDGLEPGDYPSCDMLDDSQDFIYRAILAGELRHFKDGKAIVGGEIPAPCELILRRTDLREWLLHHYPDMKPKFLFCDSERAEVDAFTQLAALKEQLAERNKQLKIANDYWSDTYPLLEQLKKENEQLKQEVESISKLNSSQNGRVIRTKNNIIAALTKLLLEPSSLSSTPLCSSLREVIDAISNDYSDTNPYGLSERNLFKHLPESLKQLENETLT